MPELVVGLILAAAEALIIIATGDPWDTAAVGAILGPILAAVGIHELRPKNYVPPQGAGK